MDNFKKTSSTNPYARKSLDGFILKEKNTHPNQIKRENTGFKNYAPLDKKILSKPIEKIVYEKLASETVVHNEASLIGMTLPNYSHSKPRNANRRKKNNVRWSTKKNIIRSFLFLLLLSVGFGGFLFYRGVSTVNKVFHGNIVSDITAPFSTTPLKGEKNGRVNILLAGNSVGDPHHNGAALTDSMIVLSINTKNNTAFLLSIPRDLWVYIPGMSSYQKINAANDVTNFSESGYPNGGMGQLEQIIKKQLGIPIDYYGLINYTAFKDAVNSVGGVTVNIQSPDPRGLYDPNTNIKLPNGLVTLNGQQALNLARARGDGYGSYGFPQSDFDRTAHQRLLLTAVAQKALSLGFLSNPTKVSSLFNVFGNNLHTDLSLQNIFRLLQVTKGINLSSIQSFAFSYGSTNNHLNPILTNYTDPGSGQEALIPSKGIGNYSGLTNYYNQLTSSNPLQQESAPITVVNATNQVGLASKEEKILKQQGYNVIKIANSTVNYQNSTIVNFSNGTMPETLVSLNKQFNGIASVVTNTVYGQESYQAINYPSSFVIILGNNFKLP